MSITMDRSAQDCFLGKDRVDCVVVEWDTRSRFAHLQQRRDQLLHNIIAQIIPEIGTGERSDGDGMVRARRSYRSVKV